VIYTLTMRVGPSGRRSKRICSHESLFLSIIHA